MAAKSPSEAERVVAVSARELAGRGRYEAAGEWAHNLLDALATERFYGDITFQFHDGAPYLARRQETLKPKTE